MAERKPFDTDAVHISLPLNELFILYDCVKDYPKVKERLAQLEEEVDALRSIQSHMLMLLGDVKNNRR